MNTNNRWEKVHNSLTIESISGSNNMCLTKWTDDVSLTYAYNRWQCGDSRRVVQHVQRPYDGDEQPTRSATTTTAAASSTTAGQHGVGRHHQHRADRGRNIHAACDALIANSKAVDRRNSDRSSLVRREHARVTWLRWSLPSPRRDIRQHFSTTTTRARLLNTRRRDERREPPLAQRRGTRQLTENEKNVCLIFLFSTRSNCTAVRTD